MTDKFGKGFSVTNLKQMRQFYMIYSTDQIGQTMSDQFENLSSVDTQIFASKYETILPSKEDLQKLLEEQMMEESK